jgi:hypothetical protein
VALTSQIGKNRLEDLSVQLRLRRSVERALVE